MALHVIRHAEAGRAPNEESPLTEAGRRRAERIADLLQGADIARVLSSRYVRCVETVAPLAARLGLEVEQHPALSEEAELDDAWALVESLARVEAVLCSHGPVISPVLDRVLRRGADITGEWSCRKGSVWRLHADGDLPFTRAVLLP